ncbi:MAG: hypothetical protein J0L82_16945 [Deltaproteobacteria bacterium]|jgi:hypothetical protein|nr:hypothetical protein [Deltaproteobacteria bacterium]
MKHSSYYRKMRLLTYAVGTLVVALMATACGNKNEGGGQVAVTPGGVSGSCVGCPTATTLLASGTGRSYSMGYGPVSGELSLQFYGDTAILATYGGAQYAGSYRGSVVAGGVFRNREARVSAGAWSGCNLPVGDYAISTTQPGQWSGQSFSTIGMSSTSGPVALTIRLNRNSVWSAVPALVDYAGAQFPFHVVTEMEITSSAGGTCVYLIDGRF